MSDTALSERPAAALEDSSPSDAMKPAASETGGGGRADVGSSQPAGMESPDASKALGSGRADMRSSDCAPGMEASDAGEAWRNGRADVGSSDRAPGMEASDAGEAWRNGRADVGNCGIVKLMKVAAKAAVESTARKTVGDGRRAGAEIGRDAGAPAAKATPAWTDPGGADCGSARASVKLAGRDASA
jgi:hypothetical protein